MEAGRDDALAAIHTPFPDGLSVTVEQLATLGILPFEANDDQQPVRAAAREPAAAQAGIPHGRYTKSNLTNTALSAYDSVNADWLQFQSTPATVQVQDWPASIITPIGLTANGFEMSARHFAPGAYQSQWTTNFIDWNSLQTTTNAQGVIQMLDAGATPSLSRFYRTQKTQ